MKLFRSQFCNSEQWELLLACSAMVHPDEQNTTRVCTTDAIVYSVF